MQPFNRRRTDENSGTAKIEYSIGESGQWIIYENPFVVSTENETIYARSVDTDHYQITGLKANTTYWYKLVTYDPAYNESAYSEVFEVTTHSRPDFQSDGNSFIALRGDGSVWTWGDNSSGQLGNATTSTISSSPVKIVFKN